MEAKRGVFHDHRPHCTPPSESPVTRLRSDLLGFGDFRTPVSFVFVLAAVYLQHYSYDDPLYVFILHHVHRQDCKAHEIVMANKALVAQRV